MLKLLHRLWRCFSRFTVLVVFLGMLLINIATITFESAARIASAAVGVLPGIISVFERQNRHAEELGIDLERERAFRRVAEQRGAKLLGDVETERVAREVAEGNNRKLQSQLTDARGKSVVKLRGRTMAVADAVEITTRQVSSRTAKVSIANVSSMAGEGVPIWGIAIIVGATTYEIASACETMSDMDALRIAFSPEAVPDPDTKKVCGLEIPTVDELTTMVKALTAQIWKGVPTKDEIAQAIQEFGTDVSEVGDALGAAAVSAGNAIVEDLDQLNRDLDAWWNETGTAAPP